MLRETGVRISEMCGFTLDLDFKGSSINIDHQFLRDSDNGFYIDTSKTKKGTRQIHMAGCAHDGLKRIIAARGKVKTITVDGYTGFLFLTKNGLPKTAANYSTLFKNMIKKYNKTHSEYLPNITPHTFRHTLCTCMAEADINP